MCFDSPTDVSAHLLHTRTKTPDSHTHTNTKMVAHSLPSSCTHALQCNVCHTRLAGMRAESRSVCSILHLRRKKLNRFFVYVCPSSSQLPPFYYFVWPSSASLVRFLSDLPWCNERDSLFSARGRRIFLFYTTVWRDFGEKERGARSCCVCCCPFYAVGVPTALLSCNVMCLYEYSSHCLSCETCVECAKYIVTIMYGRCSFPNDAVKAILLHCVLKNELYNLNKHTRFLYL